MSFDIGSIFCYCDCSTAFNHHVHQAHLRVHITTNGNNIELKSSNPNEQQRQYKKIDQQLLVMLLFQVILLAILFFPVSTFRFYLTFTTGLSKSTLQKTIEDLVYSIFVLLFYLAISISFYIYTLSGSSVFRKALKDIFIFCKRFKYYIGILQNC